MPETGHTHSSRENPANPGFFHTHLYRTYLQPAIYLVAALLLPVAAKFLHAGMLVAVAGAVSIIILTITRTWKLQAGVFLAMVCLLLMVMLNLWHWADSFFIAIFSGIIVTDTTVFPVGLSEGLITLATVWVYHKILKNLNMRVIQEWYVKKSQLKFLRLLLFLQLFLLLFWISGFTVQTFRSGSHHDQQQATLIAFIIALVAAGIPALVYFFRDADAHSKHHHHRHHRQHHENT